MHAASFLPFQKRRAKTCIEFPIVVGDLFALANGALRHDVPISPMCIGLVRMVHVVIVVAG